MILPNGYGEIGRFFHQLFAGATSALTAAAWEQLYNRAQEKHADTRAAIRGADA